MGVSVLFTRRLFWNFVCASVVGSAPPWQSLVSGAGGRISLLAAEHTAHQESGDLSLVSGETHRHHRHHVRSHNGTQAVTTTRHAFDATSSAAMPTSAVFAVGSGIRVLRCISTMVVMCSTAAILVFSLTSCSYRCLRRSAHPEKSSRWQLYTPLPEVQCCS